MALRWTYKDFWDWFQQADSRIKRAAWDELIKDDWLKGATPSIQFEIMEYAPQDVVQYACAFGIIKPETEIKLTFNRR